MPAALRAQFDLLRRRFVDGLAARWAELQASADPGQQALLLHRLAGAAGSFGFAALGRCAAAAEAAAKAAAMPTPGAAPCLAPAAALARALTDLGQQIDDERRRFDEAP